MAHIDTWTWADLEGLAASTARRLKGTLLRAQEGYRQWVAYQNSRTDAAIATAEGWVAADVTLARLALEAVNDLFTFAADGASPQQGDRLTPLRKVAFTFVSNPLVQRIQPDVRNLAIALVESDESFAEFNTFKATRTDTQIQAAIGAPATVQMVTDARVCLRSCNQMYGFANNEASHVQRDRLEDWRIMT